MRDLHPIIAGVLEPFQRTIRARFAKWPFSIPEWWGSGGPRTPPKASLPSRSSDVSVAASTRTNVHSAQRYGRRPRNVGASKTVTDSFKRAVAHRPGPRRLRQSKPLDTSAALNAETCRPGRANTLGGGRKARSSRGFRDLSHTIRTNGRLGGRNAAQAKVQERQLIN